jgi:2-C-methyl-D-erythritol 4-phosphate cytidylyltransferase
MRVHRILLSGGTGSRMGVQEPKQFLSLGGKPVLAWSAQTLENFPAPGNLVCVAPGEHMEQTQTILGIRWQVVCGGEDRHSSTLKGLDALVPDPEDLIFLHDAARPLITASEVQRLFDAMQGPVQAGSLTGPVHDTIVRIKDGGRLSAGIVPREQLRSVKTPQALRAVALPQLRMHNAAYTDLLGWAEAANLSAVLVESDPANIKLTTASDLRILEAMTRARPDS